VWRAAPSPGQFPQPPDRESCRSTFAWSAVPRVRPGDFRSPGEQLVQFAERPSLHDTGTPELLFLLPTLDLDGGKGVRVTSGVACSAIIAASSPKSKLLATLRIVQKIFAGAGRMFLAGPVRA